ncbi:lysophospholipid acyltransferase family protein [Pseudoxanthomonas sp.]|uniref:lysophospholipid acyltransferase family protein n=1 Tax=Pseudoxanthomonas sp. TaxID=1871049 RepID=UPI00260DABAE|nr:lysophospholipid acyltransferase family protein [Pseudoxanthomonas sp.]WDS35827.1 MAG: lysophospholipid acyltransferase family protein [Pseudoxanthomonas sp.]
MIVDRLLVAASKALFGAYPRWLGSRPDPIQRIYFANHSSHLDTVALWSALPPALRRRTRPVAARDYWGGGGIKGLIAGPGLNVVLIDRQHGHAESDPLEPLYDALDAGDSLILFPEGTRNLEPGLLPFKSGLYHLARRYPGVELVAVYLDNARRSMPKGSLLPVPLICTVRFGQTLRLKAGEEKAAFLERTRLAVEALAP